MQVYQKSNTFLKGLIDWGKNFDYSKYMGKLGMVKLLLRVGIAFVFVYAAVSMSLKPEEYSRYLPVLVKEFFPPTPFLHFFGIFEIILSLWLISGKWNLYPSILASATIFALTIVNLSEFNTLFRNVGIFFASLALIVLNLNYDEGQAKTR